MTPEKAIRYFLKYSVPNKSGCVIWNRSTDDRGYGTLCVNNKTVWAHRFAYEYYFGPIPKGMEIHHTCENESCVSKEHLVATTRKYHPGCGPSVNRDKTHCIHGHEYTPENTFLDKNGYRHCKKCRNLANYEFYHRSKT